MFAVIVRFEIWSHSVAKFKDLVLKQAANSLKLEDACSQFDVVQDASDPSVFYLYEIYDDRAAFDVHLASAHFKQFDTEAQPMIARKEVWLGARVAQTEN
ncbi:putative quinol monooxygenase [Thalassospira australica]|uniref:putative quinol monooxygenase n=1 Tax=Thalassospira australica TaxID=1528106 RepID=UPI00051A75FC|nr:putative quinol monooxygenase [Thalassospira australica]